MIVMHHALHMVDVYEVRQTFLRAIFFHNALNTFTAVEEAN